MKIDLSNVLLEPEKWPAQIKSSLNFNVLSKIAELSVALETRINLDVNDDKKFHEAITTLFLLLPLVPKLPKGHAPAYMRNQWDLTCLHRLLPSNLMLKIEQDSSLQDHGHASWHASLMDGQTESVQHPSFLEHNSILFYRSAAFSRGWTPNIAVGRIVIAAYLLAALKHILDSSEAIINREALALSC